MWFDTILWLVAIVAFIAVEAATTALVSVWFAVSGSGHGSELFQHWLRLAGACFCRRIGHYAGADDSHSCQPPR